MFNTESKIGISTHLRHVTLIILNIFILGVVTAELKEDCEGKPNLIIHPNGPIHCVNDDLSKDFSESDGKQTFMVI